MATMHRLFISYSHLDSRFVDRLQQDLRLRDFDPWVDRSRLEGGQTYPQHIQQIIRDTNVVLVVLSPESVASEWVLNEIHEAKSRQKRIVPLMLRQTDVPFEINRLQYIDFQRDYDAGLTQLLRDLIAIPTMPAPAPLPAVVVEDVPKALRSTLFEAPKPLPPPDPDLSILLGDAFDAHGKGKLEHCLVRLEQIHERDPQFNGGFVARMLPELRQQVRAQRILRLRTQARGAVQAGSWHEAAGAWEALLGQDAQDNEAQERLPAALGRVAEGAFAAARWEEAVGAWRGALSLKPSAALQAALAAADQNRQLVYVYNQVRGFVASGNIPAARAMLTMLWQQAPAYGDPAGLAAGCGLPVQAPGLAGPWAAAQFEQFVQARQWADAALLAEMAQRAAPGDATWQQRAASMRVATQLAPIQDRYDAAAKAFRWPEAAQASAAALALTPGDPAWKQRQVAAQERQREEERWTPRGLPSRLARIGFTFRRGKKADLILPPMCDVPGGTFQMGDDHHQVPVEAFQMARFPVTVAEWKLAREAGAVGEPPASGNVTWQAQLQHLDHPVVCVSWLEAMKYIAWLIGETGDSAWKLPTEAEWEKAASWDTTVGPPHARVYPWGDAWDPKRANASGSGPGTTTPVGLYAVVGSNDAQGKPVEVSDASPYGCHDMAGNVWEWCSSIYSDEPYQRDDRRENNNDRTNARVLRGGSWGDGPQDARAADRLLSLPEDLLNYWGFRVGRAGRAG